MQTLLHCVSLILYNFSPKLVRFKRTFNDFRSRNDFNAVHRISSNKPSEVISRFKQAKEIKN